MVANGGQEAGRGTDDDGQDKNLPAMENLGVSPLPDGNVRLLSQYDNKDLAYVGGTRTKYVPIGDRVEELEVMATRGR